MRSAFILPACAALLAGCAPDPALRHRDTTDGTGLPRASPPGVVSSFPPGDTSFAPLRCVLHGPDTECSRD